MSKTTIESVLYLDMSKILEKMLNHLERFEAMEDKFHEISTMASAPLGERWLDIDTICKELNLSKKTLQSYRDEYRIPYSVVRQKIYFKASDINKFLMKHYKKQLGSGKAK